MRRRADPVRRPRRRPLLLPRHGAALEEPARRHHRRLDAEPLLDGGRPRRVRACALVSVRPRANSDKSVVALLLLVSRSKLVPDFVITLHVIHLFVVSLYAHSIPPNALWWALQICSAAFMTSLGVWGCRWRELQPINFGGLAPAPPDDGGSGGPNTKLTGDEEQGFGRGGRRGRGRDGAGEYEMVELAEGVRGG